jgi:dipeptidyl aminopeptidase/acylaminoacyl peptidase/CubicO group peptidase (beta-lactamase class C family)
MSPARRLVLDDLFRIRLPAEPAISPDGERVAYVLRSIDREADRNLSAIWLAAPGRDPHPLTGGTQDSAPAWSPDGRWLAFLRAQDGPPQVWVLPLAGGEPHRLTSLPGGAGPPVWSPDSSRLAFAAPTGPRADLGKQAPVVTDRLGYKADGTGLVGQIRADLFMVEVADGSARRLTWGDWQAGRPAWSPDGRRLAFSMAMAAGSDLSLATAAHVLDLEDEDGELRLVGDAGGMAGPLLWAPEGNALLVVGRRRIEPGHTGLLRVPLDGSPPLDLTASLDRNLMPGAPGYPGGLPQIAADGRTVVFCARDRGCTHVFTVDVHGGQPRELVGGAERVMSGISVAAHTDRFAVVVSDGGSFGEVAVASLADPSPRPLTRYLLPEVELFRPVEREFRISDGTRVHGWLLRDPNAPQPGPLLLDVHGGPHNAWAPAADPVHLYHQVLAARGWAVLLLNPRASDGYGEAFLTATRGRWGEADRADLLEPLDQLVAEGLADPSRLAVCGYSYGGFMACYLTGTTDRFRAAVAGGVVSDLTGLALTSDAGHMLRLLELGAAPFEDPERYRRLSPMTRVGQITTPTLILQGEADHRTDRHQAEQWFAALRSRQVPTRLVLYPGESHLFIESGSPAHRRDYNGRIVSWLRQHVEGLPPIEAEHWRRRLGELAARHRVPGAALGILRLDPAGEEELVEVACGVLNQATQVEATPDSLFQIGSITKVWTATVVMGLIDEGRLDLDRPVVEYLPELALADPEQTGRVTMRHLLTHTSGIDCDLWVDVGRGDDCLARFVTQLADLPPNHLPGATFSYSNAGYVLAGRVIERLTGLIWDQAMRQRLFQPLGLERTATLPEEVLPFRAALGHVGDPPRPLLRWERPRGRGPSGGIAASVGDVLALARLHLAGGVARGGTRVLSEASCRAMRERQADVPDVHTWGDSWGLGWARFDWGERLVGHDGVALGQFSFLRVLPERGLAVALLTNGGRAQDLYQELFRELMAEVAGVRMPVPPEPIPDPPEPDLLPYLGTYERSGMRTEIVWRDGHPVMRQTDTSPQAGLDAPAVTEYRLHPGGQGLYLVRDPGMRSWTPVVFYRLADGSPRLHHRLRSNPRR